MNLKLFFQIPVVIFCVHLLLGLGFLFNNFHLFRVWKVRHEISLVEQKIRDVQVYSNTQSYFATDLYQEKFVKTKGFKKRGELVLDTSILEDTSNQENNWYIPKVKSKKTNLQKWYACFFGKDKDRVDCI